MKYGNLILGQIEAIGNKLGGEEGIARFLRGELEVVEKQKSTRLTFIADHRIPTTTTPLTCDRNFAKYMGSDFEDMFVGKVEEPQPETAIK